MKKTRAKRMPSWNINGIRITLRPPFLNLAALESGGERWLRCDRPGSSLWSLQTADENGRRATLAAENARKAAAEYRNGVLRIVWRDVADHAIGAGPFDVIVEIRPAAEGHGKAATRWRIRVENRSKAWTLWSVEFPRLEGLQPSANPSRDRFFYPDCWGAQYPASSAPPTHLRYPRGIKIAMQLLGYTRGGRTFYLGVHDARLTTKDFTFEGPRKGPRVTSPARMAVTTYPEGMGTCGNGLATEYDTVVAVLEGDWYDASCLYAQWARKQRWAARAPAGPGAEPRVSREVHAWLAIQVPAKRWQEWAEQAERLSRRLGVRLGVHFYNWHEIDFDVNYPEYFPARRGFKRLVARLRRAGIVTMPYINARLWDINTRSWGQRGALRFAAKLSAQRLKPRTLVPYLEEYGSGQKLSPMCPATGFWRKTVVDLCRRIVGELGCDGVYLDQVGAERAELCFDPAHGHPLGGGGFWLQGYRRMLRQIRRAVGPGPILTTEANWEGCITDFDVLLCYHRFGDEMIPMFPAVYAGLARTFGCMFSPQDIRESGDWSFARRMAMLFAWGGQLGWGDLTVLLERRHRALCDFFAALCRTRAEHVDYFADGRMLRPPRVTITRGGGAGAGGADRNGRELYCSLWGLGADGSYTLFVVNPRRGAIGATVRISEEACVGLKPTRGPGVKFDRWRKQLAAIRVQMPPLSVRAIPLG